MGQVNVAKQRNALTRSYEPLQPFLLLELAKAAGSQVFIDIGANIGVYSLFFSRLPQISRIIAFEAAPQTFREMTDVVAANGLTERVELHNRALSDNNDPLQFGIISTYSGANSVIGTSIHDHEKFTDTITVQATRLDQIVDLRDQALCLKIDVEGHEPAVLAGAVETLKHNHCVLQMENYGDENAASPILQELGFRRCFSVGPDAYLTNCAALGDADQCLGLFEAAASAMIKSNLSERKRTMPQRPNPIRRRLPGGIFIEIQDPLARSLRRLIGKSV